MHAQRWAGCGILQWTLSANFYFSPKISVSRWQMRFLSQVELRISGLSQLFSGLSQVQSQLFRGLYVVRACSFCSSPFNVVLAGGLNICGVLIHVDSIISYR